MDTRELMTEYGKKANIDAHPKFITELIEIVERSGERDRILIMLSRLLNFMQEVELCYLCKHKNFEHLKKYGNLYSLHIDTKNLNLRILFSINREGKILLHTFFERQGKKNTEYSSHAPIALERREEYFGMKQERL